MAVDFSSLRFTFPERSGFLQTAEQPFNFPTAVRKASPVINGFSIGFGREDHHLYRHEVETEVVRIVGDSVTVKVTFGLRDSSGFYDDPYSGYVDVVLMVDRV